MDENQFVTKEDYVEYLVESLETQKVIIESNEKYLKIIRGLNELLR